MDWTTLDTVLGMVGVSGFFLILSVIEFFSKRRVASRRTSEQSFTAEELVLRHYKKMFDDIDKRISEAASYGADTLKVGFAPGVSRDLLVRKLRERGFSVRIAPIGDWGGWGTHCHGYVGGCEDFVEVRW